MILFPQDFWEIKTTKNKGQGIFAKKDIPAGVVIGDYIGKVIRTATENTIEGDEGLYLMYYHDYASIYPVDIKKPGVHLINHSCVPNAWMYIYHGHTLFFTLRKIFKGEELTISYLLSPKDEFCNPCRHKCLCGEKICTGTMHLTQERFEKWRQFSDKQAKLTKKHRITYGKVLKNFESYPENIPDSPIYTLSGFRGKTSMVIKSNKLHSASELRSVIREKGRTIEFPKLKLRVLKVEDGKIFSEAIG